MTPSLRVRMIPCPLGFTRWNSQLSPFPWQWQSSSLHYGLFWALSPEMLHCIHNSSRISIFIKHFERSWFNPKRGKGEGVINISFQNECSPAQRKLHALKYFQKLLYAITKAISTHYLCNIILQETCWVSSSDVFTLFLLENICVIREHFNTSARKQTKAIKLVVSLCQLIVVILILPKTSVILN